MSSPASIRRFGETVWEIRPGQAEYSACLAEMEARAAAIRAGTAPEAVWLLEHGPVYTAGTSARAEDLRERRFPVHTTGRGGQWTYHGPGQLVAYVMLDLTRPHGTVPARDVRAYVAGLERWVMAALATFGVRAESRPGRVGLWVEAAGSEAKIAAIGVRVTRWVSWHGVAINVTPDLAHFGGIVPCGITEYGVTSLAALGIEATTGAMGDTLRACWVDTFGA